jgi:hypothetical protein
MTALLLVAVVVLGVWIWIERGRRKRAEESIDRAGPVERASRAQAGVDETSKDDVPARALDLSEKSGDCGFGIVGESNYQPQLRKIARGGRTFIALLVAEPTNSVDSNAIRVCSQAGNTIGYLSRENAVEYREVFALLAKHNHAGACRAKLIGGVGAKTSYGVLLNMRDVPELLTDIRDTVAPGTAASSSVEPF